MYRAIAAVLVLVAAKPVLATGSDIDDMLSFVSGFKCHDASWTRATSVCQWKGVSCQDNVHVSKFDWDNNHCAGKIRLGKLPNRTEELNLGLNQFSLLDMTGAPSTLQRLLLQNNELSGPLDLSELPPALTDLTVASNRFDGPVDLTSLPLTLTSLSLGSNNFRGPVNLTHLPNAMHNLFLWGNKGICGTTRSNIACMHQISLPSQCACNTTTNDVDCGKCS